MNQGQLSHRQYPSQKLDAWIAEKVLQEDSAQGFIANKLDRLLDCVIANKPPNFFFSGRIGSLWRRIGLFQQKSIKGIYIYGGVGRGKTMLMDMFFESVKESALDNDKMSTIWRLHFHDFMVLAQDLIHEARQKRVDNPIEFVANELAKRGRVICFDEMEVRDIADAMILARLFSRMLDHGTVVVVTSNRHADDLYKDGLHRDRFLPFISLLKNHCEMCKLGDGADWRSIVLAGMPAWYTPSHASNKLLDKAFKRLAGNAIISPENIRVAGRDIIIEKVAGDIGFSHFANLCDVPLGARDYLAIAGRFAGLVISDIPQFTDTNEHLARRFMWLIDALYDRGRFLIASASTNISELYSGHQWQFEFDRTASRLGEMAQRGKIEKNS